VLDAIRALAILAVAVLAWRGAAQLWQVYLVSIIVAGGFWMFWPTINALIQELTPESDFVHANSFLIAGLQGGWLIAGAMVGFLYNWIGLSGILFIDFASYVFSFTCYLFVRRGRQTVRTTTTQAKHEGKINQYFNELREGVGYIRFRPRILLLGFAWAFFVAGMLSQGVLTAPYSDRLLNAGAYGYGWLNSGWAIGACLGAFYTAALLRVTGQHRAVGISMAVLGVFLCSLPLVGTRLGPGIHLARGVSVALVISVAIYGIMGCARSLGGVAITTLMMEMVPIHFMGRVQNTFYFAGTCLQFGLSVAIGAIAHNRSLAYGFYVVGALYLLAATLGVLAMRVPEIVSVKESGDLVIG